MKEKVHYIRLKDEHFDKLTEMQDIFNKGTNANVMRHIIDWVYNKMMK